MILVLIQVKLWIQKIEEQQRQEEWGQEQEQSSQVNA